MQAEDRSSSSSRSSGSSVWIDPAYMRHNYISEQENASHSHIRGKAASVDVGTRAHSLPGCECDSRHAGGMSMRPQGSIRVHEATADLSAHGLPTTPRQSQSRQTRKLVAVQRPGNAVPLQQKRQSSVWQYDSSDYEIESSIAALSLVIPDALVEEQPSLVTDLPTRPELPVDVGAQFIAPATPTESLIAELPTRPDHPGMNASLVSVFAEIDTVPPPLILPADQDMPTVHDPDLPTLALIPAHVEMKLLAPPHAVAALDIEHANQDLTSWTAGGAAQSRLAQRLVDRSGQGGQRRQRKRSSSLELNPLDQVRWWLLKPRSIEFILWLAGTILLVSMSLALLLATCLSFGWLTIGPFGRFSSSSSNNLHPLPTIVTYSGLKLVLVEKGPFLPGQSIHLHGEGFTPGGDIFFTYDRMQRFSTPGDMASMAQVDAHGAFTISLVLGTGPQWYPGLHLIEARDLVSGHLAAVKITIFVPTGNLPTGNGTGAPTGTATPVKIPSTPGSGNGNMPTPGPDPGGQTPVPTTPTPTAGITPTPTTSPSPTPTVTPTPPTPTSTPTPPAPTPTPTPGITPTP
jgi:hypothetical protein